MTEPHPVRPAVAPRQPLPPRPSAASRPPVTPGAAIPAARPPVSAARPPRPEPRPRPDPNPVRLMAGFIGLASLSAIATGLLPSVVPSANAAPGTVTIVTDAVPPAVKHVTRYVQLKPGQTAPPQTAVVAAPKPTPRIVVVTTTRQSGKP